MRKTAEQLLAELKARENELQFRKVVWRNGQPTLVESTKWMMRTRGMDLSTGRAATDKADRVPSGWEAKRDAANREPFKIEELGVMSFSGSAPLPVEYYQESDPQQVTQDDV